MSIVTTPYTYVDGAPLTEGHNKNIFSTSTTNGIMSEPNGGITTSNLADDFEVQKEHVHAEEVCRGRKDGGRSTIDYMTDVGATSTADAAFLPIAGASVRVYVPYACSVALWQVSLFCDIFRVIDAGSSPAVSGTIQVQLYKNGLAQTHTNRVLPQSIDINSSDVLTSHETISGCAQLDLSHMETNISAGWHEIVAQLFMEPNLTSSGDPVRADILVNPLGTSGVEGIACDIHNRVSFGFRGARVLTLL